jgi:hypothetical protein
MESRVQSADSVNAILSPGTRSAIRGVGVVEASLYGNDGVLKNRQITHNTVTTLGLASIINQCAGTPTQVKLGWMELGTSAASGVGKLGAAIVGRHALDSLTNTASANAVLSAVCTFSSADASGSILEAGLFSASGNDVIAATTPMYAYTNFSPAIDKQANDSLVITWAITLS